MIWEYDEDEEDDMPRTGIVFMISIPSRYLADWRMPVARERRSMRPRRTRSKGPPCAFEVFDGGRSMKSFARIRSISSAASLMLDLLSCFTGVKILEGWRTWWIVACGIKRKVSDSSSLLLGFKNTDQIKLSSTWVSWWRDGWEMPRGLQPGARGREGQAGQAAQHRRAGRQQRWQPPRGPSSGGDFPVSLWRTFRTKFQRAMKLFGYSWDD